MSDEPGDAAAAVGSESETATGPVARSRWARFRESEVGVIVLTALGVLAFPFLFPIVDGYTQLATLVLIWGIFAVGFDLLLGYTGLLSFGHAVFWGGAAYAAGVFSAEVTGSPIAVILFGTLFAVLLAWVVGFLSLRRGGIYFAILTLTFGQMSFYLAASPLAFITNGENGYTAAHVDALLGVIPLGQDLPFPLGEYLTWLYLFVGFMTVLSIAAAYRILNSPYGIVFRAIRENELRAEFVGLNVWRYKLAAFIISGAFAGIAGSLFTVRNQYVPLESLYWTESGTVVIMTVLGGVGSLFGPMFGAGLYLYIENIVSGIPGFGPFWHLVLGIVFVVVIVSFPEGIWGGIESAREFLEEQLGGDGS